MLPRGSVVAVVEEADYDVGPWGLEWEDSMGEGQPGGRGSRGGWVRRIQIRSGEYQDALLNALASTVKVQFQHPASADEWSKALKAIKQPDVNGLSPPVLWAQKYQRARRLLRHVTAFSLIVTFYRPLALAIGYFALPLIFTVLFATASILALAWVVRIVFSHDKPHTLVAACIWKPVVAQHCLRSSALFCLCLVRFFFWVCTAVSSIGLLVPPALDASPASAKADSAGSHGVGGGGPSRPASGVLREGGPADTFSRIGAMFSNLDAQVELGHT